MLILLWWVRCGIKSEYVLYCPYFILYCIMRRRDGGGAVGGGFVGGEGEDDIKGAISFRFKGSRCCGNFGMIGGGWIFSGAGKGEGGRRC